MARLSKSSPQSEQETRPTFKEKGLYLFDKCMAAGLLAQIGLLALVTAAFVLLGALLLTLAGLGNSPDDDLSFRETTWRSLMHAMDAGPVNDDKGWALRGVMLSVTILGVVVMGGLIGIIGNALTESMTHLRKGRSPIMEEGYTLILGWSPAVFNVVCELVKANQKKTGRWRVVIMSAEEKVKMEDEIRDKLRKCIGKRHNTEIICRTGNPIDVDDLGIVKPHQAKSIVILSPLEDDPDSHVIKTILAILHTPIILAILHTPPDNDVQTKRSVPHIVHELRDIKNQETVELVGQGQAHFIDSHDVIARIIAQTCRQSGMSEIYTELLDYNENQIYFVKVEAASINKPGNLSELIGVSFGAALSMLPNAVLIGLMPVPSDSEWMLNPAMDRPIEEGNHIIVIAESENAVQATSRVPIIDEDAIQKSGQSSPTQEKTLILGWNARGRHILKELNEYVQLGSQVTIVADTLNVESDTAPHCANSLKHQVEFRRGDPTSRTQLQKLEIANFHHIIVLGDDALTPQQAQKADTRTLVTLLNLRKIKEQATGKTNDPPLSIVSEMLIDSNRKLAEVTQDNDFIVSDKLIGSLMTQISQRVELKAVFDELLNEKGAEIYLKPAKNYVKLNQPVSFYTVIAAASRQGECAIGYREYELCHQSEENYGIKMNPHKSDSDKVTFGEKDRIIVIAEKEWGQYPASGVAPNGSS